MHFQIILHATNKYSFDLPEKEFIVDCRNSFFTAYQTVESSITGTNPS